MVVCAFAFTVLSACGGGGGGDAGITVQQPTTAVITLATSATDTIPATTTINSYEVKITLPAGVTVKSSANPPETDINVVTASGKAAGASISGVYTAATGTFPAMVSVYIVKVDPITGAGFDPGEFCKVTCDIAAGYYPKTTDFPQPTFFAASGWDTILNSTVDLTYKLTPTSTVVVN